MMLNSSLTGIASHLLYSGLLNHETVNKIVALAQKENIPLISYLVNNNYISSEKISESCVKTFHLPFFDLKDFNEKWLNHLSLDKKLIRKHHILPLYKKDNILHIGVSDPTDRSIIDTILFYTGIKVSLVVVDETLLSNLIEKYYSDNVSQNLELSLINKISIEENNISINESEVSYEEPVIKFVNNILEHAIQRKASDIHIEPYEKICRIRYRQDGILTEITEIPNNIALRLITRLKVIAKLDISERRIPQDGRFQTLSRQFRINTCPTLFGEKIVLRLLNSNQFILDLNILGFTEKQLPIFKKKISQAQGLILVTGPTGSGKTITLYSALQLLNQSNKNISTVEDPIEIQLPFINQINIHPKIGLDFSKILRSLLRQDPDIIMVGEIRDQETAEIAIQAAQTGHLVLSTLHTNNSIEAITRLQSMGIETYKILSSLTLILAQRLVRKLCQHCKKPDKFANNIKAFQAVGCQHCLQGYSGRTAIYEFLPFTEKVKELILQRKLPQLVNLMKKDGNLSLKESGQEKILQGITTFSELSRVLE